MSIAISNILNALSNGVSHPNRFLVQLPNDDGTLGILCFACTLPSRGLQTFEIKQRGTPYKVPFSQEYQPVTLSFYAAPELNTRRYFDKWHKDVILTYRSNILREYDDFAREVRIKVLDRMGATKYTVAMHEAWPLNIGEVDLNYGTNNTYTTITVTLTYKFWNMS